MNPFEMVVIIVFIAIMAGVVNTWIKEKFRRDDNGETGLDRLDALEERIRVLEKIVTDRSYDLKEEIRRL